MLKKQITFILVPLDNGQVREYRFPQWTVWMVGLVGLFFFSAFSYYAVSYYQQADQQYSLERLELENAELMRNVELTQRQVAQLGETMDDLVEVDEKLRFWHEMEPDRPLGVGGPEFLQDTALANLPLHKRRVLEKLNFKIERLQLEAKYQEASFARITQKFLASGDSLRHIPTIFPVPRQQVWQSSPFGNRNDPFTGRKAFHTGVDFAGRKGTPIVATADGVVLHTYFNRRLGNVIAIEHDILGEDENGAEYSKKGIYRTEYAHLEKVLVKKGDRVRRWQKIGTMGNTGRSTGPHLHYAVRYQDSSKGRYKGYVDPEHFLLDAQPRDKKVAGWLLTED